MELADHWDPLYRSVARLVGEREAEDVVQEALLRAVTHPPRPGTPLGAWLHRVARNLAIDHLRKFRRVQIQDDLDPADVRDDEPAPIPLTELLARVGGLSDGELAVTLLRDALGLEVSEVADALRSSPGSVRVLHHRARQRLAQQAPSADAAAAAVRRFLDWLLARTVAGLPVIGGARGERGEPASRAGVAVAYERLVDAMVEVAHRHGTVADEARARVSRGIARGTLGQPEAAVDDFRFAAERGPDPGLAWSWLFVRLQELGRTAEAREAGERALAHPLSDGRRAVVSAALVRLYTDSGDVEAARDRIAALKGTQGHRRAFLQIGEAHVAMAEERYADARDLFLEALALARDRGIARNVRAVALNVGSCMLEHGDDDAAEAWLRDVLAQCRLGQDAPLEALSLSCLAQLEHRRGPTGAAAEAWERAIAALHAAGSAFALQARMYAAILDHARGHPERALERLDGVASQLGPAGFHSLIVQCDAHRAALRGDGPALVSLRDAALAARRPGQARACEVLGWIGLPGAERARLRASVEERELRSTPVMFAVQCLDREIARANRDEREGGARR